MNRSNASKAAGGLLVLCGLLGVGVLTMDQVLRGAADPQFGAPVHYYILMVFVALDFVFAGFAFVKPEKGLMAAGGWSVLRIILQLADVSQAHSYMFKYQEFIDYLFNPMSQLSVSLGNPPGVPGAYLDLIILFELIIIILWKKNAPTKSSTKA